MLRFAPNVNAPINLNDELVIEIPTVSLDNRPLFEPLALSVYNNAY